MGQAWKRLIAVTGQVNLYLAYGAAIAIFGMFASITYDVFMRFFFFRPTTWALDIGEMLMLPAGYLAAALLLREGGHIRVAVLINRIHGQPRAIMELATYIIGLFWGILIVWRGLVIAADFIEMNKITFMAEFPLYPAALLIVIGGAFLVLEFLIRIVDGAIALRRKREEFGSIQEAGNAD